jgi:hypothetical protein
VLLRLLHDALVDNEQLVEAFCREEHYADLREYLIAAGEVWGENRSMRIVEQLRQLDPARATQELLLEMPEPNFLRPIERGVALAPDPIQRVSLPARVNAVCGKRGVPYEFRGVAGAGRFRRTGDSVVHREVLEPWPPNSTSTRASRRT